MNIYMQALQNIMAKARGEQVYDPIEPFIGRELQTPDYLTTSTYQPIERMPERILPEVGYEFRIPQHITPLAPNEVIRHKGGTTRI